MAGIVDGEATTGGPDKDVGGSRVEHGGELMPFDDGSMTADKAQSSAMNLVINYAEPVFAAGTAVFGLGLLVLPLLARINSLSTEIDYREKKGLFSYEAHGETNTKLPMRLFTESEMKQRFGLLDAATLMKEITLSVNQLDEYMNGCEMDQTDDEVNRMQKWRDKANANLKSLQKRSALAFLGLPPEASETDINKMYKKMALELHPDKGGDPEKFQELQEMKDRLTDLDKDEEDKKKDEDEDDEEARKAKEKEKEEEEEGSKLPPDERVKKLRMDVHDTVVRLWERANKSIDEIVGDKSIKSNAQPALNILRLFVDRFVTSEIKTLRHDDVRGAETKFRKFLKQGAEIIAVAALHDVQTTLSTIAMNFNYRLVARSGSPEIKNRCAALLEAIADVPTMAESFLKNVRDKLAESRESEKHEKQEKAARQKAKEARGDFSGEACDPQESKSHECDAGTNSHTNGKKDADPKKPIDPFSDFDFGDKPKPKTSQPKVMPKAKAQSEALKVRVDEEKSTIATAMQNQKRTGWDPNFDHPYAGALKSNGTGVYCRPCQRWIVTYEYNVDVFFTHVERVHPKPPPGWTL